MSKPKLLWVSDNPKFAYVGQSRVSREFCDRLSPFFDLHVAGFWEPEKDKNGKPTELEIIREWQYPITVIERYKEETLKAVVDKVKPEIILFSHDCWLFPELVDWKNPETKLVGYFTIDGDPVSRSWKPLLYNMDHLIVPSNYAKKAIQDRFHDLNVDVIPYAVDHSTFSRPVDKEVFKKTIPNALGFHDALKSQYDFSNKFICTFYGHNQFKKNLGCLVDAWSRFSKNKQDVYLLLIVHSRTVKRGSWSTIADYDVAEFMKDDSCLIVNGVYNDEVISHVLKGSDFLAFPSIGEGFGLPVIEALASGTIPFVTNFSSVTDFANESNSFMLPWTPMVGDWNTIRAVVHPDDMLLALESAYQMWKTNDPRLEEMRANGVRQSMNYQWDQSGTAMKDILMKIANTPKYTRLQTLKRL